MKGHLIAIHQRSTTLAGSIDNFICGPRQSFQHATEQIFSFSKLNSYMNKNTLAVTRRIGNIATENSARISAS